MERPTRVAAGPDPAALAAAAALQPPLVSLGIVAGATALLFFATAMAQLPLKLIDYRFLGYDFNDFWAAAGDMLAGQDPYLRARFVTPPLSAIPFLPFAPLSQPVAAMVFCGINIVALTFGIAALVRAFALGRIATLALALTCALSPCTLMLVERGNLDGLVFVALSGFLLFGEARLAGPLCLALAACLKLYPAVFIPALVARGQVRSALVASAVLAVSLLLMPCSSLAFLHNQAVRAGGMRLDENLSALTPFWVVDEILHPGAPAGLLHHPVMALGALAYGIALCACLWCDLRLTPRLGRPDARLLLATYAGFCIGLPSLVYLYSGVSLLVLLAALGQDGLRAPPARLRALAVAVGLAMVPAKSLSLTLGPGWTDALNAVPPMGSLGVILLATLLRRDLLCSAGRQGDAAP